MTSRRDIHVRTRPQDQMVLLQNYCLRLDNVSPQVLSRTTVLNKEHTSPTIGPRTPEVLGLKRGERSEETLSVLSPHL